MGDRTGQLDTLARPSLGCEPTYEINSTSIGGPQPQLHSEVLNTFSMYRIEEYRMLSTFLDSSWERGCVNLRLQTDLAEDIN